MALRSFELVQLGNWVGAAEPAFSLLTALQSALSQPFQLGKATTPRQLHTMPWALQR